MSRELGCWWCCCAAHQAKMRAGISIYCWLVTGPARTVCQTAYLPTYLPTGAISDKFGDCSYTKWFWILSSSVWFLLKDWRKHLTSALQIATVAYPIRTSTSPTYVCLLLARPWGTQPKSHSHPTGGFFPISQIHTISLQRGATKCACNLFKNLSFSPAPPPCPSCIWIEISGLWTINLICEIISRRANKARVKGRRAASQRRLGIGGKRKGKIWSKGVFFLAPT